MEMKMNDRKKKVLQAIIHDYIQTAEPVGSRTISKKYNLKVSPATIRNEMSDLEEMGLIEQPHTSAGRIPSNSGYRYYVDCLMEKQVLSEAEEYEIEEQLTQKIKQIEDVIQVTSRLLSDFTKYTSLVDSPQICTKSIKHVQLIPFQSLQALAVIVTENGAVLHQIVPIQESITVEDLSKISTILNRKLSGQSFETLQKSVLDSIYHEMIRERQLIKVILEFLEETMMQEREQKIYLGGTLNILNQPEFKDVEKVRRLLGILDEEEVLKNILGCDDENVNGLSIKIGNENSIQGIDSCSVITATYAIDGTKLGTIGILGPTRMNYAKVVTVVDVMSKTLSKVLGKHIK